MEAASTDWVPKFRLHQPNSPISLHSALRNAYLSMEESLALFAQSVWGFRPAFRNLKTLLYSSEIWNRFFFDLVGHCFLLFFWRLITWLNSSIYDMNGITVTRNTSPYNQIQMCSMSLTVSLLSNIPCTFINRGDISDINAVTNLLLLSYSLSEENSRSIWYK